jgi:hypothetical protein
MAGPITWRTVNGPSLAEAGRPMESAQRSFDNAFTGLGGVLKQQEATDQANWNQVKENNTQNFLNKLYSAQGAEGFKALQDSGELDRMLAANGAQIDRAAARSAMDGRLSTLQNRDTQAITYKNTMLDDAQANDVRRINTLALTDPAAASAELAKNPDLRKSFEIAKNIDSSAQTQVERQRAKDRFGFDINDEQRKAAEEAQRALLRPLAVQEAKGKVDNISLQQEQLRAQINQANNASAASRESVLNSQANRKRLEDEAGRAVERQRLATALEGNMYAEGVYKDSNTVDLAKIMKDYSIGGKDEDAGKVRSDITKRLNKLAREGIKVAGPDGKTETLPIPLGAVKAALLASTDSWGPDNFGSSFERELKNRMQGVRPSSAPAAMSANPRLRLPTPAAPAVGAENLALNDWLAFKNITRSSAEVAPASKKASR